MLHKLQDVLQGAVVVYLARQRGQACIYLSCSDRSNSSFALTLLRARFPAAS